MDSETRRAFAMGLGYGLGVCIGLGIGASVGPEIRAALAARREDRQTRELAAAGLPIAQRRIDWRSELTRVREAEESSSGMDDPPPAAEGMGENGD